LVLYNYFHRPASIYSLLLLLLLRRRRCHGGCLLVSLHFSNWKLGF